MKTDFRSIRAAMFDAILPPKADPKRVGLVSAGNPDVLCEAAGIADYANPRKRKRGDRVKIVGVRAKHRLDRPSRRKFGDGGAADADQPAADAPGIGSDVLRANPKARAIGAALTGIDKANQVLNRWGAELTGSKPAYHRGGSARR
jgi:hypothetical protein